MLYNTSNIIVVNAPVMTNRTKIIELLVWYLRSGTEEAGVSFSLKKKKSEKGVLFVSQWDSVCFYVLIMAICSLCHITHPFAGGAHWFGSAIALGVSHCIGSLGPKWVQLP